MKLNAEQKHIQNILYLIGLLVCTLIYFCIYYWHSLEAILFTNGISLYSIVPLLELVIKNVFIWLIPAVIIDKYLQRKILYSAGLNLDRFAIRDILYGTIFALAGLLAIFAFIYFTTNKPIVELKFNDSWLWIISNLWTINDATVEELIFRGFIFQSIFRKNNSVLVIFISSLLFAFVHFFYTDWNLTFFVNVFLAGVLFCQMYAITMSLWSSIAFHSIWNIVIFNVKITGINNIINIEYEYITIIVLVLLIILVNYIYKPSYKINRYFLLNS